MKVLYNQIKQFVPGLKATPKQVADALTVTGIMVEKMEEVEWQGKKDFLLSLEVRQNRPDCLGVIGVSREVAAYFGKKVELPALSIDYPKNIPAVAVAATEDVRRALVVKLTGLVNGKSPEWLQAYLQMYGINSIDLIVDFSNYAMLITGFPNHVFDADKVAGSLTWKRSSKDEELITLDGTILSLKKNDHLVIADAIGPLVLASAVGGKRSAVSKDTKTVLIEVAVYNSAKLLQDARSLAVVTEAGNRLQKDLAIAPAKYALEFLIQQLIKYGKAKCISSVYDYCPKPKKQKTVVFSSALPSIYSGITITPSQAVTALKNVGCTAVVQGKNIRATAPQFRTDIDGPEDFVEEVIRIVGYDKIPIDEAPLLLPLENITSKRITLANRLRMSLAMVGFDEIRSLPLTSPELNAVTNYLPWEEVRTQNSINEEFPVLRQSLVSGLFLQEKNYLLKNIEHIAIFEVGKVFGKTGKHFAEHEHIAGLLKKDSQSLVSLKASLEVILRTIGVPSIMFVPELQGPKISNPHACFKIMAAGVELGLFYKLRPQKLTGNSIVPGTAVFEINVDALVGAISKNNETAALELAEKLVVLDVNITRNEEHDIAGELQEIRKKIGKFLWSLEVIDRYVLHHQIRYTLRLSYRGITDAKAKLLHDKIFA